ncbi:MAG: TldD/PmbA family protein [bacterium]
MQTLEPWQDIGRTAVKKLQSDRFDLLQSFVESKQKLKIVLEDEKIDEVECGRKTGLGLSAVDGQNTNFFSYSSPDDCRDDLDEVRRLLDVPNETGSIDWSKPTEETMPIEKQFDATPVPDKRERVNEADAVARNQDDRIEQVRVTYNETIRNIEVIDRNGWIRREPQRYLSFNVLVVAQEDGRREKGYGRHAGYRGEELFESKTPADLAREAAGQAIMSLEADPAEQGPRTVVIAPGFGGTIFHEACGHGFEADHIYEDVSRYAGRMNESVASDLVTFVDEGSLDNHYGSFRVDDEGTESRRNVLIKDGVMRGLMSDRKYADLLEIEPTGNGRRESFNYPTLPRMTNTYIENGESDPESIIESTEDGIYAAHIGGGQVDHGGLPD